MKSEFFQKVPSISINLIKEIEIKTGFEIDVRINSNNNHMTCFYNLNETVITAPCLEYFIRTPGAFFHEVLHLYRNIVQNEPRLFLHEKEEDSDNAKEFDQEILNFDNHIEHFSIIPLELSIFPERKEYWFKKWMTLCKTLEDEEASQHLKFNLFMLGMSVDKIFPASELQDYLRKLECKHGYYEELLIYKAGIYLNNMSKKELVQKIVNYFNLPWMIIEFRCDDFDLRLVTVC